MSLVTPQTAAPGCVSIAPADSTNLKIIRTCDPANTKGELVGRLRACSTDTVAQTLQFVRYSTPAGGSATDFIIGESQVPAGAGTNGATAWKDLLADLNGGAPITLAPGEVLKVKSKVAVTSACKIDITSEPCSLG